MPFENEHAARLHPPGRYKRFRRENDKFGSGIHAVWGVRKDNDKVELQAIRFDRKKFTVAQAKRWLKDHDHKAILFEPATGKGKSDEGNVRPDAAAPADNICEGSREMKPANQTGTDLGEQKFGPEDKTISKYANRHSTISVEDASIASKAKAPTAPNGYVEGYAVRWDNTDLQGEVMRRGSFVKSIQERVPAGKVLLLIRHFAHGGDFMDSVGKVVESKEDDYGLWFRANFFDDKMSQAVREKVNNDVVQTCSIGFRPIKYGFIKIDGRSVIEHTECAMYEVTLTAKPANEGAILIGSKDAGTRTNAIVTSLTALQAVLTESDPSSLVPDDRGRRLDDALGDRGKAEELLGALKLTGDAIRSLQAMEPPGTDVDADGTNAAAKAAEGAAAKTEADRRLRKRGIEARKMRARVLLAEAM